MNTLATDLNDLIQKFGPAMAAAAESAIKPVHDPANPTQEARNIWAALAAVEKNRTLFAKRTFRYFDSQAHKIAAIVMELRRFQRGWMVCEMGCGKTPMGLGASWALLHTRQQFRVLVLCPGHIVKKWKREAEWALPGAHCAVIKTYADLRQFEADARRHKGPAVAVISKDTAKLGHEVDRPTAWKKKIRTSYATYNPKTYGNETAWITMDAAACPHCGAVQTAADDGDTKNPLAYSEYVGSAKTPVRCDKCKERLATCAYSDRPGIGRRPHLDRYIQRKMRNFFDILIADEVHELAGADTAQGNAFGTLASACRYTMALTGTLIGGHARDLHAPMWRMSPDLLRVRGFNLKHLRGGKLGPIGRNTRSFIQRYGVLECKVQRDVADDYSGRMRRGRRSRRKEYKVADGLPRPGISPDLFNHFLIGRAVFMNLSELGPALPTIERVLEGVEPSPALKQAYTDLDGDLLAAIEERSHGVQHGPPVLAGIRIQCLDAYLDKPWGWEPIKAPVYNEDGELEDWEEVAHPADLGALREDAKDARCVEICKSELNQGRKCAIYPVYTGKHDVRPKIAGMLRRNGLRAVILPDNVEPSKREEWIEKNEPDIDILIVHPKRVMTGLDLIQFPSLIWYQLGYSTHVLRQASARARRPIQTKPCKVFFLYYKGTIQEQALGLMGEKEAASQALEGTFDTAALKALMNGGESPDILSALAHAIERPVDPAKTWAKVDRHENFPKAPALTALRSQTSERQILSQDNYRSSDSEQATPLFDFEAEDAEIPLLEAA